MSDDSDKVVSLDARRKKLQDSNTEVTQEVLERYQAKIVVNSFEEASIAISQLTNAIQQAYDFADAVCFKHQVLKAKHDQTCELIDQLKLEIFELKNQPKTGVMSWIKKWIPFIK